MPAEPKSDGGDPIFDRIPPADETSVQHFDVLIIGAGLSGIGAAHHLQDKCPGTTYGILEARDRLGGTWDLFRYPGVRSDSDMFTLGYRLRPWSAGQAIADGPSILGYVEQTAREQGIDRHIRFGHRVARARWSTAQACWTVTAQRADDTIEFTCGFLYCCSGYYRYDEGFTPTWPGTETFVGRLIHPQHWPADLDYAGKRVVVIGSGATAVTLVPAIATTAASVTMLQRSPSYVLAIPADDVIAVAAQRFLPPKPAFLLIRWKNILTSAIIYAISRRRPEFLKKLIRQGVQKQLPDGYDVDKHFAPTYNPWDQRLCLVPDGDLFTAIRTGRASIVTDQIDTFTGNGVKLSSGRELEADIVVTATGLNLLAFGGIQLSVDGKPVDLPETMAYKSLMLTSVPNFAFAVGYTNASWTLKVDLTSEYVCRLLNFLDANHYRWCVPVPSAGVEGQPFLDFRAGYVLRSLHEFPKQGNRVPWRVTMNYLRDLRALRRGPVTDEMQFHR